MRVYGIVNCDTVRKARAWLDARGAAYEFVDFRKAPPSPGDLARWSRAVGWEALLNRRGTSWRALDDATKAAVVDEASAIALMARVPTLIKRPVVERGRTVTTGFAPERWGA
ncbi:MAG: arsenate reductase [Burkholderiales bacterium]|nr:arsenate reductase [Burkholderiales bacterium]GIK85956.1 MAG: arsenate reductase [Betaproteobacteria bacterium]